MSIEQLTYDLSCIFNQPEKAWFWISWKPSPVYLLVAFTRHLQKHGTRTFLFLIFSVFSLNEVLFAYLLEGFEASHCVYITLNHTNCWLSQLKLYISHSEILKKFTFFFLLQPNHNLKPVSFSLQFCRNKHFDRFNFNDLNTNTKYFYFREKHILYLKQTSALKQETTFWIMLEKLWGFFTFTI